jgi:hypothetical protein
VHESLVTAVQIPLSQDWPGAQAFPQAPQSVVEVCTSAHPSLQLASAPHDDPEGVHAPWAQLSPLAHATPQAPQLLGDTWRSTHPSSHETSGARHEGVVP